MFRGENRKYGFEIYSVIREKYRPHLTSEPFYDSKRVAKAEGRRLLDAVKSMNLDEKRKDISNILGDDAETVGRVIDSSKEGR